MQHRTRATRVGLIPIPYEDRPNDISLEDLVAWTDTG